MNNDIFAPDLPIPEPVEFEDAPIPAPVEEEKPAETPPPRRRHKADAPILTIENGDEIETEDAREAAAWHEIHNAYRTRRILSAPLGGIEQTDSGKTIAVVDYNGYTVMSNHHLRNKNLSLKAKGLLSQMLSLPDDWDYTLKGLAAINKESVDAIRTAIWELEDAGYVVRTRVRDERGCLRGCDYYVYEYPQASSSGSDGSAESVPPMLEPLASDSAALGNPMQLNKEIQNKEKQNKEKQNTDPILSEGESVRTKVRDNIELDLLCHNQPESAPVMQEIYELVVETIQLRSPVLRLGNNLFPTALVRERLLQLTSEHIRFVLDGLYNLRTDVKNIKKYLLAMLFNAPVTLNGRTMLDVRKSVNSGFRPMLA